MTDRTFFLLGSGEFEPWSHEVEARLLRDASGDGSVVILPTASATEGDAVFDRWARMGEKHFAGAGVTAAVLPVKRREDAEREDLAVRVEAASMIYFSGGKPSYLASVLDGTPLFAAMSAMLERGGIYAGCSAGAMVASRARDDGKGPGSSWRFGLGLVPHVSFGVHWDRARKIPGLAWWTTTRIPDDTWFVGIDERTAITGDGERWEVTGLGRVSVRRGHDTTSFDAGQRFETPA